MSKDKRKYLDTAHISWVDETNQLHWDLERALEHFGWAKTRENEEIVIKMIMEVSRKGFPNAPITVIRDGQPESLSE